MIPFLDLQRSTQEIRPELDEAYHRVMNRGQFVLGNEVEGFEAEFAAFCGTKFCVGVGNGFDALVLALRSFGIGPGDEVIVPAFTFVATWLAVTVVGASIVPVDVDPETANLDVSQTIRAITTRTKAVIPVHLYGRAFDVPALRKAIGSAKIVIIEDTAQAHGAKLNGTRVGSLGHAGAFSFYPGKNLGAFGDAGAVTTDSEEVYEKLKMLRNYGQSVKYHAELAGCNSRLDELHAAQLRVKLRHLDRWNARRRALAALYSSELVSTAALAFPYSVSDESHVWHLYVIRSKARSKLQSDLMQKGVQTLIHYPFAPFQQNVFRSSFETSRFPVAESLASCVLSLPMFPQLSEDEVQFVSTAVKQCCGMEV